MKPRFEGRVALVTGAARGQGRSHALGFAREGADLVVNDICENLPTVPYPLASLEELNETVKEIEALGRRALPFKADVSRSEEVREMMDRAISEFGRIDILVVNHGICAVSYAHEMTEEEWDEMLRVNLKAVWLCCRHVVPHMMKQNYGRIIATGSTCSASGGWLGLAHYTAAKHGVLGLTKALAFELAPYNITCNAVLPSAVKTPMNQGFARAYPEYWGKVSELIGPASLFPPGYLFPDDITSGVLWLASEEARYVTGVGLPIDGGFLAK